MSQFTNLAFNNVIKDFDQRRLRPTTIKVRTADGRVAETDRNDNVISTATRPADPDDDIARYGFIVNTDPDLQVGEVLVEGQTYCFGSQDVAEDLDTLEAKGITHIINLISSTVPNKFDDQFEYLSCVLYDDLQADLLPIIDASCAFIRDRVRPARGRVFIHCNAGVSRAPSVLIGCLIQLHKIPFDLAYRLVDSARNISPNLNFKMQLRELSARVVSPSYTT